MSKSELVENMQGAWSSRGTRAVMTLQYAQQAPALFKPETIIQAVEDVQQAQAEMLRWAL